MRLTVLKIQYYGGRALGGGVFHIRPGIAGGKKSRCCIYGGMYVLFEVEVNPQHQVAVLRLCVGKPQCLRHSESAADSEQPVSSAVQQVQLPDF